jgi:hypothetical protein
MATSEEIRQALAEHRQAQSNGRWNLALAVLVIVIIVGTVVVLAKRSENQAWADAAQQTR